MLAKADESLLDKIEEVIGHYKSIKNDPYDALPEVAQSLLKESENQLLKNETRLHQDVIADAKKKFSIDK